MNFLTPLAFGLAALLPIIVALYFLKLRREEQRVSSTYLWRTLVRDTAANAPWQRLRPNLLLLLQLLFLAALIFALARPFTWSEAAAGSHLILVIDTSASMGATDVKPDRLAAATASARKLIESLPASARVTVIEAGAQVRVPVSGASNPGAALASLRPNPTGADFASALTLAAAMAAREPDSEVVILSDGRVTLPENLTLPARVRYLPVGEGNNNQAIGAFSVQAESGGRSLTAFAQMVNYAAQPAQRRLVIYADGQLLAARDVTLPPGKPQALTFPGLPPDAREFEARLEGQDLLAADDRAWAVAPSTDKIAVRIVGPGNRFLETALSLLPNVQVNQSTSYSVTQSISYSVTQSLSHSGNQQSAIGNQQSTSNLIIFDMLVPTGTLPDGNLLFIAPPRSTELFSVTGRIDAPMPGPVSADDPLLRYVDLRDVAVQDAARIALPAWGRAAILDTKTGAPLLIVGERDGRRLAVLAFDLRRSDLTLRVAFPLLMANLLDALVPGGVSGIPASVEPGRLIAIPAPSEASAVAVRAPDDQIYKLTPSEGRALFDQTDLPGVYQVDWQDDKDGREGGIPYRPMLGRFAVNLFSAGESDITPRETLPVASAGATGEQALPRARSEWWRPIAWAALALLVAEWLLSQRGQVAQLFRLATDRRPRTADRR